MDGTPVTAAAAIVVTSIHSPSAAMRAVAAGALQHRFPVWVVGDAKGPAEFGLAGTTFVSLAAQKATTLGFAALCPTGRYARKNVGYLLAMRAGAAVIIETDDDNVPDADFFTIPQERAAVAVHLAKGWVNVYRHYSELPIWPRGLPLDAIRAPVAALDDLPVEPGVFPIHQRLVDGDPDVDAIYRLVVGEPCTFRRDRAVALGEGAWCPFNSQNTVWWRRAFPLLYLPSHCSFRMTDIWRSFVAQRIAWTNGWRLMFHGATAVHERNPHDLMANFEAELPGYLGNRRIAATLEDLDLQPGEGAIPQNLATCYRALVALGAIAAEELPLLDAWLGDLATIGAELSAA